MYIPKAGGRKRRPLGIPVILDRAHQARVAAALEPEWEARFEPRSYGFRPGRGCHDAIQAIYQTVKGTNPGRRWVLDADLAGAFDQIAHQPILDALGLFPARGMIRQWLRAGVVENGRFSATEQGTPQGGVISPVLLNVALHGIEQAAGVRYAKCGTDAVRSAVGSPTLIRYADDLVALCHTRQQALEVKARLATWLAPRGLVLNEYKTRVVSLDEGFDFLGFHVRRYRGRPLIKPSQTALRRIRQRLRTELRSLRGHNARAVIRRLNPIIRGWAAYYRTQVSSQTFHALDQYLWQLTYKWALISHRNKSRPWVFARYFDKFNRTRQDRWVFGDRTSGVYLHRFSWTGIVRHQIVCGTASPDDPSAARLLDHAATQSAPADQQHQPAALPSPERTLPDLQDRAAPRRSAAIDPQRLGTMACYRPRHDHDRDRGHRRPTRLTTVSYTPIANTACSPELCPPPSPRDLLEPDAVKAARPVLRRAERREALGLSDRSGHQVAAAAPGRPPREGEARCPLQLAGALPFVRSPVEAVAGVRDAG